MDSSMQLTSTTGNGKDEFLFSEGVDTVLKNSDYFLYLPDQGVELSSSCPQDQIALIVNVGQQDARF